MTWSNLTNVSDSDCIVLWRASFVDNNAESFMSRKNFSARPGSDISDFSALEIISCKLSYSWFDGIRALGFFISIFSSTKSRIFGVMQSETRLTVFKTLCHSLISGRTSDPS